MAQWAVDLFGAELSTKDGMKATAEVVSGKKAVLIYCSAHWCPPCRGFTPILSEAYRGYAAGDVEVVFVSSDRDQSSFDGYFGEMPWVAVPFADRARKETISSKFGVRGIPMLMVLNGEDGTVVSQNGRGEVQSTKDLAKCLTLWGLAPPGSASAQPQPDTGSAQPHWSTDLFGDIVLTKDGKKATMDVVDGKKAVLVYCSAHWCPPCRGFTPMLAAAYQSYAGGDVEVIFVSSDRDQSSFDEYFGEMPWAALPFADRERQNRISQQFNVQGIPTLVVLSGEDGKVMSQNGRSEVQSLKDLGKCLPKWGLAKGSGQAKATLCPKAKCCSIM